MSESKTNEVKIILEKIQAKLQASAFTELAVLHEMNKTNENGYMKKDNNKDFYDFIEKLEKDPTPTILTIAKKLRVAYLYINLEEPAIPTKREVEPAVGPKVSGGPPEGGGRGEPLAGGDGDEAKAAETVKTKEQIEAERIALESGSGNGETVKQIENAGQQSTKMLNNNEVEKRRSSEKTGQINNKSLPPAPIVAKSLNFIEPNSEREHVVNLGTVFNENNTTVNRKAPNDQLSMSSSKQINTGQKNDKVPSTLTLKKGTNTNTPNPLAVSAEESKTTEPTLSTATANPTKNRPFIGRSKFLTTYKPNTPKNFLRKSKGTRKNSSSYVKEGNLQEYGKQDAEVTQAKLRH